MATIDNNLIDPEVGVDCACGPEIFVSISPAMRALKKAMEKVASSEVPVLILGEPGTGKRALAFQIHQQSERSHETFSEVECGRPGTGVLLRWKRCGICIFRVRFRNHCPA